MKTVKDRLEYALNLIDDLQVFGDRDIEIARTVEEIIAECIEDLAKIKDWIKELIRDAENHELYDVKRGLYSLLKQFGVRVERDEWGDYYIAEDGKT